MDIYKKPGLEIGFLVRIWFWLLRSRENPSPPNVGEERQRQEPVPIKTVVDEQRPSIDPVATQQAPIPRVVGIVAVVSHDKEGVRRDDYRPPVLESWPVGASVATNKIPDLPSPHSRVFRIREWIRSQDVRLVDRGVVDVDRVADHRDRVARHPNDALHDIGPFVFP